jgi:hypothetical protein
MNLAKCSSSSMQHTGLSTPLVQILYSREKAKSLCPSAQRIQRRQLERMDQEDGDGSSACV